MNASVRRIVSFFAKLLAAYGLWYVVYDQWLLPKGHIDQWLSFNVAQVSGTVLSGIGLEATVNGRDVLLPGVPGVRIVNGCNGLSTIGLFIGFVVAFPGKMMRRLLFIPIGMFFIYLANVARICLLLILQKMWPVGFSFMHDLGAPSFFYLVVFALWVVWFNYGGGLEDERSPLEMPREAPSSAA